MQTTGTTVVDMIRPPTSTASPRLAELVVHLTDCNPRLAIAAVDAAVRGTTPTTNDECLTAIAQAMMSVRRRIDLRDPK